MSKQLKVASSLSMVMIPGEKYKIDELIKLLPVSNFHFSDLSKTPIKSEPNRPRWNRWVRNAVRNSPDRTDHNSDWWINLRAEIRGPTKRDWVYWIE
jgi:hypothetical protein